MASSSGSASTGSGSLALDRRGRIRDTPDRPAGPESLRNHALRLHVGDRKLLGQDRLDHFHTIGPRDGRDEAAGQETQLVVAHLSAEWHAALELLDEHLPTLAGLQIIDVGMSLGETMQGMLTDHQATSHNSPRADTVISERWREGMPAEQPMRRGEDRSDRISYASSRLAT